MAAAASSSTDAAMAAAAAAGAAAAGGDNATAVRELDPIELPVTPIDINFHPQQDVIAVGLVDGLVQLYVESNRLCCTHDFSLLHVLPCDQVQVQSGWQQVAGQHSQPHRVLSSTAVHTHWSR